MASVLESTITVQEYAAGKYIGSQQLGIGDWTYTLCFSTHNPVGYSVYLNRPGQPRAYVMGKHFATTAELAAAYKKHGAILAQAFAAIEEKCALYLVGRPS